MTIEIAVKDYIEQQLPGTKVIVGEADQSWQPPFIAISTPSKTPGFNAGGGDGTDESIVTASCYGENWDGTLALRSSIRKLFARGFHGDFAGVWVESIFIRQQRQIQNYIQDGTQTGNPGYAIELQIMHSVTVDTGARARIKALARN